MSNTIFSGGNNYYTIMCSVLSWGLELLGTDVILSPWQMPEEVTVEWWFTALIFVIPWGCFKWLQGISWLFRRGLAKQDLNKILFNFFNTCTIQCFEVVEKVLSPQNMLAYPGFMTAENYTEICRAPDREVKAKRT